MRSSVIPLNVALNAAIETAGAGDARRGFAVVAGEVLRLSEQTSRATDEIVTLVRSMQDGTSEVARGIEAGAQEVLAGTDVAAEAGNSLESIREAVGRTAGQVSQISDSADQLAASTDRVTAQANDVNASIESISAMLEETRAASEESSASTDQLSRQMSDLAVSAEELSALAGELRRAWRHFNWTIPPHRLRSKAFLMAAISRSRVPPTEMPDPSQ